MSKENNHIFSSTELTPESFKELLPDFFEEIREDFELLKESLILKDLVKMRLMAHKIKGSAASYSAILISEKARLLQENLDDEKESDLKKPTSELKKAIDVSYQFAKENFGVE